jgi:hypothetical protein
MTYFRTYSVDGKSSILAIPYFPSGIEVFPPLRLYYGGYIARDSSLSSRRSNDRVGDDECCNSTYIVILAEAEEAADLGGTLGTETLGVDDVGKAGQLVLALLDDGESKDRQVHADDAATDGLSLALTSAAGSVAGVAFGE